MHVDWFCVGIIALVVCYATLVSWVLVMYIGASIRADEDDRLPAVLEIPKVHKHPDETKEEFLERWRDAHRS